MLHPNCGLPAVNHCKFDGRPGSIPTAPTNRLSDWLGLSKNGRGKRGQIVLMIRFVHEFSAARTPGLEESRH